MGTKHLIIAEKPDLAIKIVKGLGTFNRSDGYFENNLYIVTFAFGHLLRLKTIDEYMNREKTRWVLNELPFIPYQYEYVLKEDVGVRKQYKIIKELYTRNDVTEVINAGDPDREGSVIILNILNKLIEETRKEIPIKRVWLKATEPEYVRQAFNDLHPEHYYGNNYEEGLVRTYADWLYGMNYSRFVSIKGGTLYPVGRVLIPIVKYIYDRDKQIAEFKKDIYYEIEGIIDKNGELIKCKIKDLAFKENEEQLGRDKLALLKQKQAFVTSVEEKDIKKFPPKLFSLDTLQNKVAKEYKLSPSETLSLVQTLYLDGYVTYPRTNTEYMATAEKKSVGQLVNLLKDQEGHEIVFKDSKAIFDDTKVEGHTALIITKKLPDMDSLSDKEKLIYNIIKNRFICNFLCEQTVIQETVVKISVGENEIHLKGTIIKQPGYLTYEPDKKDKYLPGFTQGEKLNINFDLVKKNTTPPSRVTEEELNSFLKSPFKKQEINEQSDDEEYKLIMSGCEIGTVATRAAIIDNAYKYDYIKKEKNALLCTTKGVQLINTLKMLEINMDKEKTVEFGMKLKRVYKGELSQEEFMQTIEQEVKSQIRNNADKEIQQYKKSGICKCPSCGGEILPGEKNYYCSNYKEGCKFVVWKTIAEKKLTENQIRQLIEKGKTSKIQGFKSKSGKKFEATLVLKKDFTVQFDF